MHLVYNMKLILAEKFKVKYLGVTDIWKTFNIPGISEMIALKFTEINLIIS